ncbi:hypothetical protein Tco_0089712 [Tanacetum coccineum]
MKRLPITISVSGLMPNTPPSTPYVPHSRTDWDILFQPLFDELLNPPPSVDLPAPPSVDNPAPEVIAPIDEVVALVPDVSTGSPSSTTVDQDATITNSLEGENRGSHIVHQKAMKRYSPGKATEKHLHAAKKDLYNTYKDTIKSGTPGLVAISSKGRKVLAISVRSLIYCHVWCCCSNTFDEITASDYALDSIKFQVCDNKSRYCLMLQQCFDDSRSKHIESDSIHQRAAENECRALLCSNGVSIADIFTKSLCRKELDISYHIVECEVLT